MQTEWVLVKLRPVLTRQGCLSVLGVINCADVDRGSLKGPATMGGGLAPAAPAISIFTTGSASRRNSSMSDVESCDVWYFAATLGKM